MRDRKTVKIESLTAGNDRRREFLRLGRCQNEDNVLRRFLKRFQKRVESRGRKHVNLIDDEYAIFKLQRGELRLIDQLAHIVDAVVGCRVDLDDIGGSFLCDPARFASRARIFAELVFPVPRDPQNR